MVPPRIASRGGSPALLRSGVNSSRGRLNSASQADLAELGWDGTPGIGEIRFSVDRLPLVEGTFQLGVTLVDADGSHRYHRIDRAAQFMVSGADDARGPLLFEGEWELAGTQPKVGAA